jgi:hypothetical protein
MFREFWLPTLLAALIVIAMLLGVTMYFQAERRSNRELCAQGKVWACPQPTR